MSINVLSQPVVASEPILTKFTTNMYFGRHLYGCEKLICKSLKSKISFQFSQKTAQAIFQLCQKQALKNIVQLLRLVSMFTTLTRHLDVHDDSDTTTHRASQLSPAWRRSPASSCTATRTECRTPWRRRLSWCWAPDPAAWTSPSRYPRWLNRSVSKNFLHDIQSLSQLFNHCSRNEVQLDSIGNEPTYLPSCAFLGVSMREQIN